tara:strand:- start:105 stop:1373 length:1269 start_codon:yes stop_codon:yes gene_type:complete
MKSKELKNNITYARDSCRLCLSKEIEMAVNMGKSPISEKYVKKENLENIIPKVSLNLYFCKNCSHVQLIDVVNPDFLWADFTFKTARDIKLINHFKDYVERVINVQQINDKDLILDIGSNDGTLLQCFKDKGFQNILGVDPASQIVDQANLSGIKTIKGYFNLELANKISSTNGKAKVITANNVFAHMDDLRGMLEAIKFMMNEESIFVFEVSYLLDVVKKMLIGTIFHEHLSYHSIISLKQFLNSFNLDIIKVERGPEQGGSIICYAKIKKQSNRIHNSVFELIELEKKEKLDKIETIQKMNDQLTDLKNELNKIIKKIKHENKTISGFGAARSGTTFLSYFGIGNHIDYLYDDNKEKHFKFSPGDQIEVLPTKDIDENKPDYLIILAWIHADNIISKNQNYLENGGAFLRFFPKIEIIKK